MKRLMLGLAALVALASAAGPVSAAGYYRGGGYHGYHSRYVVGLNFGFPLGYPYPYYYPNYPAYYPAPVVVQQQPTHFVEQPQLQQQAQPGYWYFCPPSQAYYPYVRQCAVDWQRVAPQPAN